MPKYFLSLTENPNENILWLLCSTDFPVFEMKAKINLFGTFWRHELIENRTILPGQFVRLDRHRIFLYVFMSECGYILAFYRSDI